MKFLLILIISCSIGCASNWTSQDTIRQTAVISVLYIDMLQTREIIENPNKHELNPIIGKKGENVKPEIYFPAVALLHTLIASRLSSNDRIMWQGTVFGVQLATITLNEVGK